MQKEIDKEGIVFGLDIGTTKIVCLAGRLNEHGKLEVLGVGKSKSLGVKRGIVNNIMQTVESINHAINLVSEEFNLEVFTKEEINLRQDKTEQTGSTLPFAMYREDYLAVGGWDMMYPSPHVVDWDFFLKCEYWNLKMLRTYKCNFRQ